MKDVSANANQLADGLDLTFTVGDHVAPTVKVVPVAIDRNTWDVVFTFSEPVIIPDGAITISGAESFKLDTSKQKVTITAKDLAVVKLNLSSAIVDKSLNANRLATLTFTYQVGDNTAPIVTATGPIPSNNTLNTFNVKLTFSEKVTGVADALAGSVGITGMTTNDSIVYTLAFTGVDGAALKLVLDKSKVKDVSANKNVLVQGLDMKFTVGDHASPDLVGMSPFSGAHDLPGTFKITLTFNEDVMGVSSGISVDNGVASVLGSGKIWEVTVTANDQSSVKMTLSNKITDLSGNEFGGATLYYTTGDNSSPQIAKLTPDKTVTEDNHPLFVVEFNENIMAGSGNLSVFQDGVAGALVVIPVSSSMVNGKTLTVGYNAAINGALNKNTKYYVQISSGAVKDISGNSYAGINDKTTWTFTTGPEFATSIAPVASNDFIVYPNPFNEYLFVHNPEMLEEIIIYNVFGGKMMEIAQPGNEISVSGLSNGVYFVSLLTTDGKIFVQKLIKTGDH